MRVQNATEEDVANWLQLAAEVEHLFGPMVENPLFRKNLLKHIRRGTAFCVRKWGGKPGKPLLGGLLFSGEKPTYRIGWLAVARKYHRRGVGRLLVKHTFTLVRPPADLLVTTFADDDPDGRPAVQFYKRLGFTLTGRTSVRAPSGRNCRIYKRVFT